MNKSFLTLLGLIKRAGKLDFTDSGCRAAINEERSQLIILAADASQSITERYFNRCKETGLTCIKSAFTKYDFASALGSGNCCVLSVNESGFAKKILSAYELE